MLDPKVQARAIPVLGGVLAFAILLAATSPRYLIALAIAAAIWLGIWRYLGALPHRRLLLLGSGLVLLWGAGMMALPSKKSLPLPATASTAALPIPNTVLANPTAVADWLTWAQQNPVNARTAPGVVALEVSMLVHPDQPVFPADLAAAYGIMVRAIPSWTDSLIARYYGIQAGLIPPTPLSPTP